MELEELELWQTLRRELPAIHRQLTATDPYARAAARMRLGDLVALLPPARFPAARPRRRMAAAHATFAAHALRVDD